MASVPSRTITDDRLQRRQEFTVPASQHCTAFGDDAMSDSADASDAPTPSSDDPMAVSPNADASDGKNSNARCVPQVCFKQHCKTVSGPVLP